MFVADEDDFRSPPRKRFDGKLTPRQSPAPPKCRAGLFTEGDSQHHTVFSSDIKVCSLPADFEEVGDRNFIGGDMPCDGNCLMFVWSLSKICLVSV